MNPKSSTFGVVSLAFCIRVSRAHMVRHLCLALEDPYEWAAGGVYVMYICTLRQMGVLLFIGGYPDFSFAKTISIMC